MGFVAIEDVDRAPTSANEGASPVRLGFSPIEQTGAAPDSDRRTESTGFVPLEVHAVKDTPRTDLVDKQRYREPVGRSYSMPEARWRSPSDVDGELQPAPPVRGQSMLKTVALNNPATALGETILSMGSAALAMPISGLAGLGTEVGRLMGLTQTYGADVVHAVGDALTYRPRGEMGKSAAEIVAWPFEKLAQGAQWAGGKTLDATGSPVAATAVDTAIQGVLPMFIPGVAGKRAGRSGEAAPHFDAADYQSFRRALESGGNATAKNPRSTAYGPDQFTAGTWLRTVEQAAPEWAQGLSKADLLDLRADPAKSAQMARALDAANIEALRRADVPVTYESVYAAHHFGADAAVRIAQAAPDALVADLITPRQLAANQYLKGKTKADMVANWERRAERGAESGPSGFTPLADVDGASNLVLPESRKPTPVVLEGPDSPAPVVPLDADRLARKASDQAADIDPNVGESIQHQGIAPTHLPDPSSPRTARYGLIEAEDLRPSHDEYLRATPDYPEAFGRKDWSRADAEQRVEAIVGNFDGERMTAALDDASGAPIVAGDGIVEVGNARAVALKRIYQANGLRAHNYRTQLAEQAQAFGFNRADVESMRKPVMVRLPDVPADRRARAMSESVTDIMPVNGSVQQRAAGANYTGFIDDHARPPGGQPEGAAMPSPSAGTRAGKPLRREDVIVDFARAMGTSVYEGRVRGSGVQGAFTPSTGTVRVRRHADLETTAHEMAHLLDKRVPEISQAWRQGADAKAIRSELQGLSYDRTKVYEGFAEFTRHYMTQPDVAVAKAPVFSRWFDEFVQRDPHGPTIRKARDGMQDWYRQDALQRARSKIGDHRPISDAMDSRWDAFRQSMLDDLHGVYRMERELSGGKLAPNGAYESARLSRAAFSIADGAIRYGAPVKRPNGSFGWKGRGLEEILKPVARDLDNALLYFVGKSADELLKQGREHLFTRGEVDAMLALRRPEFDRAFAEYQQWNGAILDFAEAQGVINPAARAAWKRAQYLPFHRIGQPGQGRVKPGDWSGVKALTGGTENLRDILTNMTANAAMLIDKAVKNEARVKIANLAEQAGGGRFLTKIAPESRPIKVTKDAVVDAVAKAMGLEKASLEAASTLRQVRQLLDDAPALLDVLQTNIPPAGSNVVAVLREGKPSWYEVGDPILLRALESIDRKPMPWIVKWLGLPKRIGQTTITMTPDFMLANIARDTIQGAVVSRAGFRPVIDSLNGMRLRLTNDPIYREFVGNGGGLSSMFLDEGHFRTKLSRFYQRQGIDYRTVLDAPSKLLSFVETLADAFETSARLGEFKRAIDAGAHPRHAAYLAREVSTDFAMRGDSRALAFMQDVTMFLRPAMSSWDRLYRGLAHDPNRGAIAAKTGLMALMSSALYLLNKDDPRYQDLPDWDRDSHWHFFVGGQHFRYPKIWEIGAISSAAERATEKIIAADPQGLGKDFARITGATFNLNLMPQLLAPLYEQATNRNSFTSAPIETPGMDNLQPFMRAKPTTSETMRQAGMVTANMPEALQINPTRGEALLRGYFNTWAMYGLMLSDRTFFGDQLPSMRVDEMPVVRRFVADNPPKATKYETEFYNLMGEAKRLRGTLRELDKQGRQTLADDKERSPLAGEAAPLERTSKSLAAINREMREVRRTPELNPDQKRQQLDQLMVERNELIKQAVLETQSSMKERAP